MNKKIKMALYIILALIIFIGCISIWYVNNYSHADPSVNALLNGTENVSVEKVDNGLFLDGPGNDSALIFYPGAKIEYTSYLPLFMDLANDGWYISGHSLGGVMASSYAVTHKDEINGLILLASYPVDDLGNMPVLSIYGSNDKTLNKETYDESKSLMDNNLTEYVINGGNHAQFGSYGIQSGDGIASISPENQRDQTEKAILDFIY